MKIDVVKPALSVTLTLTVDEAAILKGMVQNPLRESETAEEQAFREKIWNGLSEVGVEGFKFGGCNGRTV